MINLWAVLVSAIAAMVLGFLWYGPFFGKKWSKGMGWDLSSKEAVEKMQKGAGTAYLQQFIGALLMAFVFATILSAFRVAAPQAAWMAGLQGAFWMWLGFVLPVKYGEKLWGNRPWSVMGIDLSYFLVNLIAMGMILSYWL